MAPGPLPPSPGSSCGRRLTRAGERPHEHAAAGARDPRRLHGRDAASRPRPRPCFEDAIEGQALPTWAAATTRTTSPSTPRSRSRWSNRLDEAVTAAPSRRGRPPRPSSRPATRPRPSLILAEIEADAGHLRERPCALRRGPVAVRSRGIVVLERRCETGLERCGGPRAPPGPPPPPPPERRWRMTVSADLAAHRYGVISALVHQPALLRQAARPSAARRSSRAGCPSSCAARPRAVFDRAARLLEHVARAEPRRRRIPDRPGKAARGTRRNARLATRLLADKDAVRRQPAEAARAAGDRLPPSFDLIDDYLTHCGRAGPSSARGRRRPRGGRRPRPQAWQAFFREMRYPGVHLIVGGLARAVQLRAEVHANARAPACGATARALAAAGHCRAMHCLERTAVGLMWGRPPGHGASRRARGCRNCCSGPRWYGRCTSRPAAAWARRPSASRSAGT